MTLHECLLYCARDRELVANFDRLCGTNLSFRGTAIELAIDKVTGRQDSELERFVHFVIECVWLRLPEECFA